MKDLENDIESITLTELLEGKGGKWQVDSLGMTPVVDIKLPDNFTTDPSDLNCLDCGDNMRPILRISEYPFERAEVIVRFHDVLSFVCDRCNLQDSPENGLQRDIIGRSLQIIIRQLAVKGLTIRRTSFEELKATIS